ncbi:MAG: hypothetical protein ACJAU1_001437 [Psychromonas sp.]|jgi:hypothetical protein
MTKSPLTSTPVSQAKKVQTLRDAGGYSYE